MIDIPKFDSQKELLKQKLKGNKGVLKACAKILFGHGGLFFIVAVYAALGAYILILIELPNDEYNFTLKKISATNVFSSMDYIANFAWYQSSQNLSETAFVNLMLNNLNLFNQFVVTQNAEYRYDGKPNYWVYSWTFPRSLLFTVTTIGTIGYGDITPKTSMGRTFCVYYGMLGIPLLLLFLANIGNFLADSFRYIYSRLCCRLCRVRRKVSELKGKQKLKTKVLWSENIGTEHYMPTFEVHVPIIINLCVITVTLMIGGAIFAYSDGWTLIEAIYFTFITLATIGFGDYVPGNSFTNISATALQLGLKMLFTCLFCLFGMALISMAINLMQAEMINKLRWLAVQMGVSKQDNTPPNKYNIKYSEDGAVHTTPQDKDGNNYSLLINEGDLKPHKKKK